MSYSIKVDVSKPGFCCWIFNTVDLILSTKNLAVINELNFTYSWFPIKEISQEGDGIFRVKCETEGVPVYDINDIYNSAAVQYNLLSSVLSPVAEEDITVEFTLVGSY